MGFPLNERLTEGLGLVGVVAPVSATTAVLTAAIDITKARKVLATCHCGVLGTSATVTFKAQGATTSGGSYTDISGASMTFVKATDDGKSGQLEITANGVQALGLGYKFIKFSVGADVASLFAVSVYAAGGPEEPMSGQNLASLKTTTVI